MDRFLSPGQLAAAAILAAGLALAAQQPAKAGDAGHGKAVFSQQCGVCHSAAKGGPAIVGPTLFGVVGRQAGSVKGYSYSSAMKAAGFAWSSDKLHEYVAAPSNVVPGNHMPYAGLKNPAQLDDLLAYLATLN
jgi:cytochrome c